MARHLLQIHILQDAPSLSGYENGSSPRCDEVAGPDGVIPAHDVLRLRVEYNPTRQALRDELVARGWFAKNAAARRPLSELAP